MPGVGLGFGEKTGSKKWVPALPQLDRASILVKGTVVKRRVSAGLGGCGQRKPPSLEGESWGLPIQGERVGFPRTRRQCRN